MAAPPAGPGRERANQTTEHGSFRYQRFVPRTRRARILTATAVVVALAITGVAYWRLSGSLTPTPNPVVAVRDMTDACQFLNNDELAALKLGPARRVADENPSGTFTTSPVPKDGHICFFSAPNLSAATEHLRRVIVVLMDWSVEVARAQAPVITRDGRVLDPGWLHAAKAPDKPYYRREEIRAGRASCERLLGLGPARSIEVSVDVANVRRIAPGQGCEVADRHAALVERKLLA